MKRAIDGVRFWLIQRRSFGWQTRARADEKHCKPEEAMEEAGRDDARRILLDLFSKVLMCHPQLLWRFERILQSMGEPSFLLMHSALAKCHMLMEKEVKAALNVLHDSGQLEKEFGELFNHFLSEMGFKEFQRRGEIRELFCAELFEGIGDIALPLGISNEASHHPNHMDMLFVVAIARYRNALRIFEFGTYLGRTTCGLASIGEGVLVHTLNLPPEGDPRYGPYVGQLIEKSPYRNRIRQLFCDSRKFVTDPYAGSMDFIFIDADHSYEGVRNDTEKAFEMLAPGGVVIWHDYAAKSPGVYGYLYELSKERCLFRIRNTCLVVYIDGVDAERFVPAKIAAVLEDAV